MLIDNILWAGGARPPKFTTSIENAASYEAYLNWVKREPELEIVYSSKKLANGFIFLRKVVKPEKLGHVGKPKAGKFGWYLNAKDAYKID